MRQVCKDVYLWMFGGFAGLGSLLFQIRGLLIAGESVPFQGMLQPAGNLNERVLRAVKPKKRSRD